MSVPEVHFEAPVASGDDDDGPSAAHQLPSEGEDITSDGQSLHVSRPGTPTTPIYFGSYAHSATSTPPLSRTPSPRPRLPATLSQTQLQSLLPEQHVPLPDFGLQEDRDGFFDATFYSPSGRTRLPDVGDDHSDLALPLVLVDEDRGPLSVAAFLPRQGKDLRTFIWALRSRKGVRLLRSVLAIWIAYVLCLIASTQTWLGRYAYIAVISALINHPGRSVGSQIDGLFMTCLGTIAGLSWGSLALYVSTSTRPAREGYGGILAAFLVIFTVVIAMVRCLFIRFYQAVICAGIAGAYVVLAEAGEGTDWRKVKEYGVPFAIGQGVSLVIASLVLPTAGARSLG